METNKTNKNTHISSPQNTPFISPKQGLKGQGNFLKPVTPFFSPAPNAKKTKQKAVDINDDTLYDIEGKKNDITDKKSLSSHTEEVKNESGKAEEKKKEKKQGDNNFPYVRKYSNTVTYNERTTINGSDMTFSVVERKGETYRAAWIDASHNRGVPDPNYDGYQDHAQHKYKVYIDGNGEVVKVLYDCQMREYYATGEQKEIQLTGVGNGLTAVLLNNGQLLSIPSDLCKDIEAVANKRKHLLPMEFKTDEEKAEEGFANFVSTFGGLYSKAISLGSAVINELDEEKIHQVSATTLEKKAKETNIRKLRNAADNGNYQHDVYIGNSLREQYDNYIGK